MIFSFRGRVGFRKEIFFIEDIKIKKKYQNIPAWLAYTNEDGQDIAPQ